MNIINNYFFVFSISLLLCRTEATGFSHTIILCGQCLPISKKNQPPAWGLRPLHVEFCRLWRSIHICFVVPASCPPRAGAISFSWEQPIRERHNLEFRDLVACGFLDGFFSEILHKSMAKLYTSSFVAVFFHTKQYFDAPPALTWASAPSPWTYRAILLISVFEPSK